MESDTGSSKSEPDREGIKLGGALIDSVELSVMLRSNSGSKRSGDAAPGGRLSASDLAGEWTLLTSSGVASFEFARWISLIAPPSRSVNSLMVPEALSELAREGERDGRLGGGLGGDGSGEWGVLMIVGRARGPTLGERLSGEVAFFGVRWSIDPD